MDELELELESEIQFPKQIPWTMRYFLRWSVESPRRSRVGILNIS